MPGLFEVDLGNGFSVNVLAIDPGPEQSAWLIVNEAGVLCSFGIVPNQQVLERLETWASPGEARQPEVVIEMIASYGMAVGTSVFETCVWIGRFEQHAANYGALVTRLPRLAVKMHLCHTARAKDSNVRQALVDRFGDPGTKKNPGKLYGIKSHLWPALALAVTYLDMMKKEL